MKLMLKNLSAWWVLIFINVSWAVVTQAAVQSGQDFENYCLSREYGKIARKYNLLPVENPPSSVRGTAGVLKGEELQRQLCVFFDILDVYPPTLFKRVGLRRIMLCKSLKDDNRNPMCGMATSDGTMVLQVPINAFVLHHELLHIIDNNHGSVPESKWMQANPKGFKYFGLANTFDIKIRDFAKLDRFRSSFVSEYAMSSSKEDMADTFASMMVNPKEFAKQYQGNLVVESKADLLRKSVQKFCPDINEAFWGRAQLRADGPLTTNLRENAAQDMKNHQGHDTQGNQK